MSTHTEQPPTPQSIRASDYTPPNLDRRTQAAWSIRSLRWSHFVLFAALISLSLFVAFLIFARSIQIQPQALNIVASSAAFQQGNMYQNVDANVDLHAWFSVPISDRYLVLPGETQVTVSAQGYTSQAFDIEITGERFQQFEIILTRLPGTLNVSVRSADPNDSQTIEGAELRISLRPTQARSNAEESEVNLIQLASVPGQVQDVPAGVLSLSADAPLFRKTTREIVFEGSGQTLPVDFELVPAWATYRFESEQVGVTLNIDDESAGELPLELRLEEGVHRLLYSKPEYQAWEANIVVTANEDVVVPSVELVPALAKLTLTTEPPGAAVLLEGQYLGLTPLNVDLESRVENTLQLFKPGFAVNKQVIKLNPEEQRSLDLVLESQTVAVQVSVQPSNAQVSVNGQKVGTGSQTLQLPSLSQTVSVTASGYVRQSRTFVPTASNRQLLTFDLLTQEEHYWANIPAQYRNSAGDTMLLFKEPGTVLMGSSRREPGRRSNEPEYTVELTKAFYVSTLETSNAQFRRFQSAHTSGNYKLNSLDLNNYPVARVSWQQAALYCNWLSEREQLTPFYTTKSGFVAGHNPQANGYRLLSEAEWMWLAAEPENGSRPTYPWGEAESFPQGQRFANVADETSSDLIRFILEGYDDGFKVASPVGSFEPNSKGLFDLEGNVAEWTHDWYSAQGSRKPDGSVVRDPLGPTIGEFRVVKGPSWARGYLPQLRWAYRDSTSKGRHDIGFRVARYASPN